MIATFDDYMRELHERAGIFDLRLMTLDVAFRTPHMPMPQVQHVINYGQYETRDPRWPLESWYSSDGHRFY